MILMIDNYDSFTFNIVHYLEELKEKVIVIKNDELAVEQLNEIDFNYLVISPGPCAPKDAGISLDAIKYFKDKKPILGVCLGHQSIIEAFGGNIIKASTMMHGKTSTILHDQSGAFTGLPQNFTVCRYHSLVGDKTSLPSSLTITATSEDGEIMGIRHKFLPIEGLQFHPESIQSDFGIEMLNNFLTLNR